LKNILNQVRPGDKGVMGIIERMVVAAILETEEAIIKLIEASDCPEVVCEDFSEDLSCLLWKKTEGEALS
jgi:aminoglycoside phosphotransferase